MLVILSIKPKYANAIMSGEKTVEFRKEGFPRKADVVIIYSSNHVARIIGWFQIKRVRTLPPDEAWEKFGARGAIPKKEFDTYYEKSKNAICIEIGAIHKLVPPIDPYKVIDRFRPPQSFRYLADQDYDGLQNQMHFLRQERFDSGLNAIRK